MDEDLSDSEGEEDESQPPPESFQPKEDDGSLLEEPSTERDSDPVPCLGTSVQKYASNGSSGVPSDSSGDSSETDQKATDGSTHKQGGAQVQANQDYKVHEFVQATIH